MSGTADTDMISGQETGFRFRLRRWWPVWCFLAIVLIALPAVFSDVLPQRDVAFRYAPMAEAFRKGDWSFAFHPRTGLLHTLTAGILAAVFQCGGFLACKLSSVLFMALGVFPLYGLVRRIYSRGMAEICTAGFIFASQLQRLGWSGLRDSHKTFLILLAAYALVVIYQERGRWSGYLWLGIAAGLGIITRGDLSPFMGLLFFWGMVLELNRKCFPLRSLAGAGLAILITLPSIWINYAVAGVAVPEIRYAMLFAKIMHRQLGLTDVLLLLPAGLCFCCAGAWVVRKIADCRFRGKVLATVIFLFLLVVARRMASPSFLCTEPIPDYIGSIVKGFLPVFGFFAVIGIAVRLYRKEWRQEETILAVLLFGHTLLVCVSIILFDGYLYVSPRYLIPAVPLEFAWTAAGVLFLWDGIHCLLRGHFTRTLRIAGILGILAAMGGFLYDFYRPAIKERCDKKCIRERKAFAELVQIIRNDYRGPAFDRPPLELEKYNPKHRPAIAFLQYYELFGKTGPNHGRVTLAAYLAEGRPVFPADDADYILEKCSEKNQLPENLEFMADWKFGKDAYRLWKRKKQ